MVYLISYNTSQERDPRFTTYLQRHFPVSNRILPSQFLVRSEASALALVVDLVKQLGSGDALCVSEVTQNLAWHNLKLAEEVMENWEAEARDCGS